MNKNIRILVSLDLSPTSIEVLKVAQQLLSQVQGQLIVGNVITKQEIAILKNIWNVNSLNKLDMEAIKKVWGIGPLKNEYHSKTEHSDSGSYLEGDCVEILRQERKNMIYGMLLELETKYSDAEVIVAKGHPYKEVLNMVKTKYADIVVVGSKSRSNLANTLFSSIPEKIFRHCPAHVVSVQIRKFTNRKNFQTFITSSQYPSELFDPKESQIPGEKIEFFSKEAY